MNSSRLAGIGSAVVVCCLVALSPASAQQLKQDPTKVKSVQLVPHRAVYDFTLGVVRGTKSIAGLTGRMVYEFTGSHCEGWSQAMRFVTRTTTESGGAMLTDQRSTSWEDDTASRLKFSASQYRDQKLVEQTAGTAKRVAGSDDVKIELTHPDSKNTAVSGTVMFPIQHSIKLIEAARQPQAPRSTPEKSQGRATSQQPSRASIRSPMIEYQLYQRLNPPAAPSRREWLCPYRWYPPCACWAA